MKSLRQLAYCAILLVISVVSTARYGQAQTYTTTYLTSPVTTTAGTDFRVASAANTYVNWTGYVDGEAITVSGINGNTISVNRASLSTTAAMHANGAILWLAPTGAFRNNATDRSGACTAISQAYLPEINVATGSFMDCTGGTWTQVNPSRQVSSGIASGQVAFANTLKTLVGSSGFTWDNTNNVLAIMGTTAGYSLDISTAFTDGLRITGTAAHRVGLFMNPLAGQQASWVMQDGGVTQWQIGKAVANEFFFFNAPNNLNHLVLTPGTLDTAISGFQGEVTQTRTTTNNAAVGTNFATTDNNTTGTAGNTDVDALHVAYVAGAAAAQSGNGTGINTNVTVTNTTAVASFGNEFAHIVGATVSNASNAARLWGLDFSTQSARSVADDFIQGGSFVVNRFNTGANRNGSGGLFVYTKPNSGAGIPAGNPTTYPVAVGLQVAGWSGATSLLSNSPSNATLQSRTDGFSTGVLIGGAGSGWDSPYLSDRSRIATGLAIQDITTAAINISNPYGGTSPPTPDGIIFSGGTTWGKGIDLSGGTFVTPVKMPRCASSGGTCAAANTGSVSIAAATTTVTVATTAVSASSQIFVQEDSTLGTALSVTCNTTISRTYAVTTRTAGTSFVITASGAPAANPACLNFWIVN